MTAATAVRRRATALPLGDAETLGRDVFAVLGLPFDAIDLGGAEARVRAAAAGGARCVFATPNLNFVVGCRGDRAFRDSVLAADLSLADGMPVVWIARLLGVPLPGRVAGSDLFERLRASGGEPLSVYFFGGAEGAARAASERLNSAEAGLRCAGYESPGFGSIAQLSAEASIARINASGADFLVVSLGARKGQAWIEHNRSRLAAPVVSHLGAALNFAAGALRRAPRWMQRSGLEWLWRIREERSLWRRYLSDGLAAARLLATRVLPLAWEMWRMRWRGAAARPALLQVRESPGGLVFRLGGAWSVRDLAPLREALRSAVGSWRHVRIDLEQVTYADPAFIGLLMLAHGVRLRSGLKLACSAANPALERLFELSCAEYLLEDAHPTGGDAVWLSEALELAERAAGE